MGAKRKTKSASLSEERIRDAALELIDAEGIEGFSTRKLGAALGCEAMAIYWYYPSKEALLDAVVDTLVARMPVEPAREGDWIDAFRKLAHGFRRLSTLHPKAFPLLATRRFATEGTYRFLEGLFALARERGVDERTTARFFRAISSYCAGVALNELAGLREDARGNDAKAARAPYPHLAAVWPWLEPEHYDDVFEFGLELLLDALAQAPQKTARSNKKRR